MSHYRGVSVRGLVAIAKEHGLQPATDKEDLIAQLLENDIVELAKEKGVYETGLPRLPPRLPQYNSHGQLFELPAFVAAYAMWSMQNRDILDNYAKGLRLITPDEHARLAAYVAAEDDFIGPKEEQCGEEAIKRWHRFLDAAKEVGIYVYEYRQVPKPREDRCTEVVRFELYDALEQARTDRAAMFESRRRIAEEKIAAAAAAKAAAEAEAAAKAKRAKLEAQRRRDEEICCSSCIVL